MSWTAICELIIVALVWSQTITLLALLKADNKNESERILPKYLRKVFTVGIYILLTVGTITVLGFIFS